MFQRAESDHEAGTIRHPQDGARLNHKVPPFQAAAAAGLQSSATGRQTGFRVPGIHPDVQAVQELIDGTRVVQGSGIGIEGSQKMKVVAFNGSARKNGNTTILLNTVFAELNKEGIETELVQLAREKQCVLQVGHVERFNPVLTYLESVAGDPRFLSTHRLSP